MIQNAFTCTGPDAILILTGIKRTESRSVWPESVNRRVVRINLSNAPSNGELHE